MSRKTNAMKQAKRAAKPRRGAHKRKGRLNKLPTFPVDDYAFASGLEAITDMALGAMINFQARRIGLKKAFLILTMGEHLFASIPGKVDIDGAFEKAWAADAENNGAASRAAARGPQMDLDAAAVGDLYEALSSIENDAGLIPDSIWQMRNAALAKARHEP